MNFMKPLNQKKYLIVFCVLGFILNYVAYHPGFLSPDSFEQYGQSLSGNYSDWHPPVMALLWHVFNFVHQGPQLMLVFQLCCLWVSGFLLLDSFDSYFWKALIVVLLFAPFVQNFVAYIIKDSEMALCWLLGFAILLRAAAKQRKMSAAEAVCSLLLLTYGCWVRPNAFPGCLPLCFLWVWLFSDNKSIVKKALIAISLFAAIFAGQWIVTSQLIKPRKEYAENKLFLHDLTGIYVKTGNNVFPSILYSDTKIDTAYLRTNYHPATFDPIWWNSDNESVRPLQNDTTSYIIGQAWEKALTDYPLIYLRNRLEGFQYYLLLKRRTNFFCNYPPGISENRYGIKYHQNRVSALFLASIQWQLHMPYMLPWFWFFLNFLLLFFVSLIRNRQLRRAYAALVLSGILYQLPSFFVYQVDTDFRYFYWNCISCSLAVCILFTDRFAKALPSVKNG
jgi:hypothetical protein